MDSLRTLLAREMATFAEMHPPVQGRELLRRDPETGRAQGLSRWGWISAVAIWGTLAGLPALMVADRLFDYPAWDPQFNPIEHRASITGPPIDQGIYTVILWFGITALPLALVAWAEETAGLSAGAGRSTQGGADLRTAMAELEKLMLGLDESRLSAVAVLGAGPVGSPREAEQRVYERALVAAWREAEAIESLTVCERMRPATTARIEELQAAVRQISARESLVQDRAEALLRSARES